MQYNIDYRKIHQGKRRELGITLILPEQFLEMVDG